MIELLESFITIFAKLMFAMAITDAALQTQWMSDIKDTVLTYRDLEYRWYYAMAPHAMINGAGVWIVTNNIYFGILETCLHFFIDYLRCILKITVFQDTALHILCRIVYVIIFIGVIK